MNAWSHYLGVKNIQMVPDGTGQFTKSMGMLINKDHLGFGMRSWRYSAVINNCVVEKMFVEPGFNNFSADDDPYTVSKPEHMNIYLQQSDPRHDQPLPNLDINPS